MSFDEILKFIDKQSNKAPGTGSKGPEQQSLRDESEPGGVPAYMLESNNNNPELSGEESALFPD